jgi:hypothetical protein
MSVGRLEPNGRSRNLRGHDVPQKMSFGVAPKSPQVKPLSVGTETTGNSNSTLPAQSVTPIPVRGGGYWTRNFGTTCNV